MGVKKLYFDWIEEEKHHFIVSILAHLVNCFPEFICFVEALQKLLRLDLLKDADNL